MRKVIEKITISIFKEHEPEDEDLRIQKINCVGKNCKA